MTGLLLTGIGELVTNDPPGGPGGSPAPDAKHLLGVIHDASVAIEDGRIVWAGPSDELPGTHRRLPGLDIDGRAVLPGFVDAHTHLVFGGDRAGEFAERLTGRPYADVLASEGGIRATVQATRAASDDNLVNAATDRVTRMFHSGTTTVEVKSGYGLDVETERRQLEVAIALDAALPVDVVPTFLGAHHLPGEFTDDRDGFIEVVVEEMLPACAPLARYCDVFCDDGAFTVEEARRILVAGRTHGLEPRVHANELAASGGALLAAEVGAASADHLVHVDDADVAALADAGVVAVLLPTTSFCLRGNYAPGPELWEAGVTIALATDCNPGTSYTESMPFVIAVACVEMGLTPEQAVWAATRGGAVALEEPGKGVVAPGAVADLVLLDAPSYLHLPYRPGTNLVAGVVKDGEVVSSLM